MTKRKSNELAQYQAMPQPIAPSGVTAKKPRFEYADSPSLGEKMQRLSVTLFEQLRTVSLCTIQFVASMVENLFEPPAPAAPPELQNSQRSETLAEEQDATLVALLRTLIQRVDTMDQRINQRIDEIDQKLDEMGQRLDTMEEIHEQEDAEHKLMLTNVYDLLETLAERAQHSNTEESQVDDLLSNVGASRGTIDLLSRDDGNVDRAEDDSDDAMDNNNESDGRDNEDGRHDELDVIDVHTNDTEASPGASVQPPSQSPSAAAAAASVERTVRFVSYPPTREPETDASGPARTQTQTQAHTPAPAPAQAVPVPVPVSAAPVSAPARLSTPVERIDRALDALTALSVPARFRMPRENNADRPSLSSRLERRSRRTIKRPVRLITEM